tara:strand:+ start:914 stop:1393 length:480 start_codon:yes stop_codon:yes gene_type:complete
MIRKTFHSSRVSRRELLTIFGASTLAAIQISLAGSAMASTDKAMASIKKITGGNEQDSSKVILDTPQIAENGSMVPITVRVDSPMNAQDNVKSLHLWADGNPNPEVASFYFTDLSAKVHIATRIRLMKSQNVIAVAEMSDGSFALTKSKVTVTIGGCTG